LEAGFKSWKETIENRGRFYYYKNLSENNWGEAELSTDEPEKTLLTCNSDAFQHLFRQDSGSKSNNRPENGCIEAKQTTSNSSNKTTLKSLLARAQRT